MFLSNHRSSGAHWKYILVINCCVPVQNVWRDFYAHESVLIQFGKRPTIMVLKEMIIKCWHSCITTVVKKRCTKNN